MYRLLLAANIGIAIAATAVRHHSPKAATPAIVVVPRDSVAASFTRVHRDATPATRAGPVIVQADSTLGYSGMYAALRH